MSETSFDGQMEGEEVRFIFRRHKVTMRRGIGFFLMIIMFGVMPLKLWPNDSRMWGAFAGFLVVALLGWLYVYMLWHFSFFMVTNFRIRQVTQKGIFNRVVLDLPLDKIQNMAVVKKGIMAGVLNYGDLLIKTEMGEMRVSVVGKVEDVYNELQKIMKGKD